MTQCLAKVASVAVNVLLTEPISKIVFSSTFSPLP